MQVKPVTVRGDDDVTLNAQPATTVGETRCGAQPVKGQKLTNADGYAVPATGEERCGMTGKCNGGNHVAGLDFTHWYWGPDVEFFACAVCDKRIIDVGPLGLTCFQVAMRRGIVCDDCKCFDPKMLEWEGDRLVAKPSKRAEWTRIWARAPEKTNMVAEAFRHEWGVHGVIPTEMVAEFILGTAKPQVLVFLAPLCRALRAALPAIAPTWDACDRKALRTAAHEVCEIGEAASDAPVYYAALPGTLVSMLGILAAATHLGPEVAAAQAQNLLSEARKALPRRR